MTAICFASTIAAFAWFTSVEAANGPYNPFIGCYGINQRGDFPSSSTYTLLGATSSASDCATLAASSTTQFGASYYRVSTGLCYGGPATPGRGGPGSDFTFGQGSPGSGQPCNTAQADVRLLRANEQFYGCVSIVNGGYSYSQTGGSTPSDISSCVLSSPDVIAWSQSDGTCFTGTLNGVYNTQPCDFNDVNNLFLFSDTPPTSGTGAVQQRRHQARALAYREQHHLGDVCPSGSSPCLTEEGGMAFECLEVDNELESCGGCIFGEWGKGVNSTSGIDCSLGAELGAAVCHQGRCQVTQCLEEFELIGGLCVAT